MLHKDAMLVVANKENNAQVLMTRTHLFFNQGKVALAVTTYQKKITAMNEQNKPEYIQAKRLFDAITALEFKSPHWREAAIKIRTQIEGKEVALLQVIKLHGQDLINKFMGKIETGDSSGAHYLMEGSVIRKLCLIFHSDKWHSPHSEEVFTALRQWAVNAKDLLEQASERFDLQNGNKAMHEQLLREVKEYIKTHQHLSQSSELVAEVPNAKMRKI